MRAPSTAVLLASFIALTADGPALAQEKDGVSRPTKPADKPLDQEEAERIKREKLKRLEAEKLTPLEAKEPDPKDELSALSLKKKKLKEMELKARLREKKRASAVDAAAVPEEPEYVPAPTRAPTPTEARRRNRIVDVIGRANRSWEKTEEELPPSPSAPPARSSAASRIRPAMKPPASAAPDPARPRDLAGLALSGLSGFRASFEKLGLTPAPAGAPVPALRADGAPASPEELERLKDLIAAEPKALMRRPDFFEAVSREDFGRVKEAAERGSSLPAMRHAALSEDGRDVVRSQTCDALSGGCAPFAQAPSYRRGDFVPPEELTRVAAALASERPEAEDQWEDVGSEPEDAAAGGAGAATAGARAQAAGQEAAQTAPRRQGPGAFLAAVAAALSGEPAPAGAVHAARREGAAEASVLTGAPYRPRASPSDVPYADAAPPPEPSPKAGRGLRLAAAVLAVLLGGGLLKRLYGRR